jgi:DNA-binding response OmpR family regulator
MLTARRSETDVQRALSAGAADYLAKPLRIDVFLERTMRLLKAPRADLSKSPDGRSEVRRVS